MNWKIKFFLFVFFLLLGIFLLGGGFLDNEWMVHMYRFSQWHREIDYWLYSPYIIFFWWDAYMFNIFRVIIGSIIIGYLIRVIQEVFKKERV